MATLPNPSELVRVGDEAALTNLAKEQPEQFDDRLWFAAVRTGRLGICKALVTAGLTPMKTRFDRAPLHFAAFFHKEEIVEWLLDLGADSNLQDSDEYKPLDLAFEFSDREPSPELVDLLVKAGTEINIWTGVRMGELNKCKSILKKNPDLLRALSDEIALTPLMVAARMNRLEIVQFLIELGADVNAMSTRQEDGMGGNTPL
jgi:ankyrin repeat protein